MTTLRKEKENDLLTPPQGVVGVCNDSIFTFMVLCSIPFNLICNMTTFRKRYSLTFWPYPLGRGCVCGQNICYHVAASVVSFILICNMTTFRKRYSLTFWPHPLGRGCVCGQNICYHVAASVLSFNLICNMTIFWKCLILTSAPPPKSTRAITQVLRGWFWPNLMDVWESMVLIICTKNESNLTNRYWDMAPDGQTDGRTHGRRQNYIPPTSSGDNNSIYSGIAQLTITVSMVNFRKFWFLSLSVLI